MYKKTIYMLIFLTLGCSVPGWAAGSMKQGLWEITIKSDEMKSMPKMTAQQMEQMRKMGVNVPQMQGDAMVMKMCVSKEMAERDQQPPQAHQQESECQSKNLKRAGNAYSVDIVCDGPHMKGIGKGQGTFSGNERFNSRYDFKGAAGGKPLNQHQESSGKWLAAECGNVKPVSDYLPKNK